MYGKNYLYYSGESDKDRNEDPEKERIGPSSCIFGTGSSYCLIPTQHWSVGYSLENIAPGINDAHSKSRKIESSLRKIADFINIFNIAIFYISRQINAQKGP